MEANYGMILVNNAIGYKSKSSKIKKFVSGASHSEINVSSGELLMPSNGKPDQYNYQLYRNPKVYLSCKEDDLAPLSQEEFFLLAAIEDPACKLDVLKRKLRWGQKVKEGSLVSITLPSTDERTVAMLRYKGPIGTEPGVWFGVEIMDYLYRSGKFGTTDGSFQDRRYFSCSNGCGLFVSLKFLHPARSSISSDNAISAETENSPGVVESEINGPKALFTKNERVAFFDIHGGRHCGTIKWIGNETATRKFDSTILGIETDNECFSRDYDKSVLKMKSYLKEVPQNHTLFLPESQVHALLDEHPTLLGGDDVNCDAFESSSSNEDADHHKTDLSAANICKKSVLEDEELLRRDNVGAGVSTTAEAGESTGKTDSAKTKLFTVAKITGEDVASEMSDIAGLTGLAENIEATESSKVIPEGKIIASGANFIDITTEESGMRENIDEREGQIKTCEIEFLKREIAAMERVIQAKDVELEAKNSHIKAKLSEVKAKEFLLSAKDRELEAMKSQFANKHAELLAKEDEIEAKTREVLAKETLVNATSDLIKTIKDQLRGKEELINAKDKEMQDKCSFYKERTSAVEEKAKIMLIKVTEVEDTIESMKEVLQTCHQDIQVKENTIKEMESEMKVKNLEIERCRNEIQRKTENIVEMKSKVGALSSQITNMEGEIQARIDELSLKRGELDQKTSALFDKESEIEECKQDLLEKSGIIAMLQSELQEKNELLQEKTCEIEAIQCEAERKDLEFAALQGELEAEIEKDQLQPSADTTWNISRDEVLTISKQQIGLGAWGVVYSANFRGEEVAIKIAHEEILHDATVEMVKREIMIMAHIQHPNLVRFIAAVVDEAVEKGTDTPIIISERMDMNLRMAYKSHDLGTCFIPLFCDVAYALHYLHQHRPSIIHRDIGAPNVLLKALPNGLFRAKVSDFGSANLVKQSKTTGAGAIVYCAPEMFPCEDITQPPQPQTTKVDVFSYGILLLEVAVREMPKPESRYHLLQRVKTQWNLMYELIVHCTKPLPSERPSMADILNILNRTN